MYQCKTISSNSHHIEQRNCVNSNISLIIGLFLLYSTFSESRHRVRHFFKSGITCILPSRCSKWHVNGVTHILSILLIFTKYTIYFYGARSIKLLLYIYFFTHDARPNLSKTLLCFIHVLTINNGIE